MLTAHLVIVDSSRQGSLEEAQALLRERFGITHTTLQPDSPSALQACRGKEVIALEYAFFDAASVPV